MKTPRTPAGKTVVTRPWYRDRSQFVRSEEERIWRETQKIVSESTEDVASAIVEAPPAAAVSAVTPEVPMAAPAPAMSEVSPPTVSTPEENSNVSAPWWRRWWKWIRG